MPLTHVVVLAIVQGFTEFLPISSTAHLYLTSWLLGWKAESLTFDIALHLGTLAAVLIYFFKDWVQIVAQGFGLTYGSDPQLKANPTLLWLLAIATVPVGIFGFLFNKQAESTWRTPVLMATTLIGVGLLMGIADHVTRNRQKIGQVRLSDAGAIGLAQALAIVPGVSRSGITITAGLFRNLNRESAARFSFLLSTPAIAGAAAKALYDLLKQGGITPGMEVAFAIGILVSAVTGFLVIAWFLSFLQHNTLRFFVWYRILFGLLVLILALVVRK